jgi:hypothetical protein
MWEKQKYSGNVSESAWGLRFGAEGETQNLPPVEISPDILPLLIKD